MIRSAADIAAAAKAAAEWPPSVAHAGSVWQFVGLAPGDGAWYFQQPNVFLSVRRVKYQTELVYDVVLSSPIAGWGGPIDSTATESKRVLPPCPGDSGTVHPDNALAMRTRVANWKAIAAAAKLRTRFVEPEQPTREQLAEWYPDEYAEAEKVYAIRDGLRARLDAQIAKSLRADRARQQGSHRSRTDSQIVASRRRTLVVTSSR